MIVRSIYTVAAVAAIFIAPAAVAGEAHSSSGVSSGAKATLFKGQGYGISLDYEKSKAWGSGGGSADTAGKGYATYGGGYHSSASTANSSDSHDSKSPESKNGNNGNGGNSGGGSGTSASASGGFGGSAHSN